MDDNLSIISAVAALIGVFFAFVGVFVAYKINDSVQAATCLKMYFEDDMCKAIRMLREIRDLSLPLDGVPDRKKMGMSRKICKFFAPICFIIKSLRCLACYFICIICGLFKRKYGCSCPDEEKELPWTESQDSARRLVKSYFHLAYELRFKRFIPISGTTLRNICDVDAFPLYFDVIEPMEKTMNPNYNEEPFSKLWEVCGDIYERKRRASFRKYKFKKEKMDKALGACLGEVADKLKTIAEVWSERARAEKKEERPK